MNTNEAAAYAIGIDLGGTNIKLVAVSGSGQVLRESSLGTGDRPNAAPNGEPRPWARAIREQLNLLEQQQGSRAAAVGLAAPGLASRDGSSIASMPGRLQGLEGLDWGGFLDRPGQVPVLNDAHAALLGEVWQGAARGLKNVVLLTLGTGVGGAILSDGELFRGVIGRAGHIGHSCLDIDGPPDICGMPGSLEDAIGESSLQRRAGARYESTRALVEAAHQGDRRAQEIWLRSVRALGCSIGSLANILDPEAFVLAGGIAMAGDALLEPLTRVLDEVEWRPGGHRVRILLASLGSNPGHSVRLTARCAVCLPGLTEAFRDSPAARNTRTRHGIS